MFETIDEALMPTHPGLYRHNHKLWSYVIRPVATPWLHCEFLSSVDGLRVSDVYLLNDPDLFFEISKSTEIEVKHLHLIYLDSCSKKWEMVLVRKIWLSTDDENIVHALELDTGRIYMFERACLMDVTGSSNLEINQPLYVFG